MRVVAERGDEGASLSLFAVVPLVVLLDVILVLVVVVPALKFVLVGQSAAK